MKRKRLIGLLIATAVICTSGIKIYTKYKNKNVKTTQVYASLEEKDESSYGTSHKFTSDINKDIKKDDVKRNDNSYKDKYININENSEDNNTKEPYNPTEPSEPQKFSSSNNEEIKNTNKVINYKEFFKKDLFMGDSITEALKAYEFLDEKNVYAKIGAHIDKAKNELFNIQIKNPRNIYLLYGINDMDDTMSSKYFIDKYRELIHKVKEKFPNSRVYVQSVMSILPKAEQQNHHVNNRHINQCNADLRNMAKQENVFFINIASILNDSNKNLYEPDGIHFKANFYPLWLNYLENKVK